MATAKDILVAPIAAQDAGALIRRVHYSGKVTRNSQLHFGVFIAGKLEGAMQFGPSMDKRKLQGLVSGTLWNGFIELNRMAFSEKLPRNSESRALSIAFMLMRKHYPHIEWVVSFADATQCGDGTIYRASGFVLTQVNPNRTLYRVPAGIVSKMTMTKDRHILKGGDRIVADMTIKTGARISKGGGAGLAVLREMGGTLLPGFQMRYVYFLNPAARSRLTVPVLPFSSIREAGAAMYRGKKASEASDDRPPAVQRRGSADPDAPNYARTETETNLPTRA